MREKSPDRVDLPAIQDLAKANTNILRQCSYHIFVDITPQLSVIQKRYRCNNCKGVIDSRAHHWFMLGFSMGMRGPVPIKRKVLLRGKT